MLRKAFLLFLMGIPLLGAITANVPIPVIIVMGIWILFAVNLNLKPAVDEKQPN